MKTSIFTLILAILFTGAFAQDITVKGVLKGSEDSKAIENAHIRLKGAKASRGSE